MAYEAIEPFGPPAEALAVGIVASTLANIHRPKDADPYAPADFMPQIVQPAEQVAASRKRRAAASLSAKIRKAFEGKR
jgi:hypothetical protein